MPPPTTTVSAETASFRLGSPPSLAGEMVDSHRMRVVVGLVRGKGRRKTDELQMEMEKELFIAILFLLLSTLFFVLSSLAQFNFPKKKKKITKIKNILT